MGVAPDDEETLDRAADLGIAFQLANIARDLVEDAWVGRCYVPQAWLDEAGLTPGTLADEARREDLARIASRLAELELRYRASAKVGAARLAIRCRWAVLAAASIYGGIAEKVALLGSAAWDRRVTTSRREKLVLVAKAWREARFMREGEDKPERTGLWERRAAA
jgi:phytoene synthase